jgi:predicted amidohydrolase YtcJ
MKRRNFISQSGMVGAVAALAPVTGLHAQTRGGPVRADLIINNARIYTMDENLPMAEAVTIMGERILAVGSNAELSALQGSLTTVIDATGCTVTPGFIDAHSHPDGSNEVAGADVNLRSIHEIKAVMHTEAGRTPPGQWVIGNKYDDTKLSEERPARSSH